MRNAIYRLRRVVSGVIKIEISETVDELKELLKSTENHSYQRKNTGIVLAEK
ncbi:hypothetical protein STA3757_43080 [Stanieria sp. NIES-3757]|nr:hypothetical protein STA3757_43080 [Stanieria sp. NIES-3757]